MVAHARQAAEILLTRGITLSIVNARFVKPLYLEMLSRVKESADFIVTIEENALRVGCGQAVADYLLANGYLGKFKALGIPDRFITHGNRDLLLKEIGLDPDGIVATIEKLVSSSAKHSGFLHKLIFRKNGNVRKKVEVIPAEAGIHRKST